MTRICIFCGANPGLDPDFEQQALNLADAMATRKIGMVYGGSSTGLMGIIADRALKHESEVIGIIPKNLVDNEIAHTGLTELREVCSMNDRKQAMLEAADAFVALPGGYGTLDELFEALTNAQLHLHRKPIGILNVNGYFDSLLAFLDHAEQQGLLKSCNHRLLQVGTTPEELLDNLFHSEK